MTVRELRDALATLGPDADDCEVRTWNAEFDTSVPTQDFDEVCVYEVREPDPSDRRRRVDVRVVVLE